MAAGHHNGSATFKNPDPQGPFLYGDTSRALSDGLPPPKIRGNGGLRHHRTTGPQDHRTTGPQDHRTGIRKRMQKSTP